MWAFQQQKKFIDLIIHIGDDSYECHKLVLASVPGYFRDLFCLDFQETTRDEITINVPNPNGIFSEVLRYHYTKNKSIVTSKNAMSIHIQAIYFRLPELTQEAESVFRKFDISSTGQLLQQVHASPVPFLPPQIVELLAQSFHQHSANTLFVELPASLLLQVLEHPSLQITNDRQLVDFLDVFHQKRDLSPETREKCGRLVQWQFLSESDWDNVKWQLFVSPEKKEEALELRRKQGNVTEALAKIQIAVQAPDLDAALSGLRRYFPRVIEPFTYDDNFFENPTKYHVNDKLLKKGQEIVVSMTGRAGLYLSELRATVSVRRSVDLLTIVPEAISGAKADPIAVSAVSEEGTAVFTHKFANRILLSKLILRFTVDPANQSRFAITFLGARGFSFFT
jgi:hypothetical protein